MRGNAAILKCTIPSFVADFVHVVAWIDEDGYEFVPSSERNFSGGKRRSKLTKFPEIPDSNFMLSFWILILTNYQTVVNQFYDAEITKEYVMRGNSAILKCLIPSFVADFVHVVAWINEDQEEIFPEKDYTGGNVDY